MGGEKTPQLVYEVFFLTPCLLFISWWEYQAFRSLPEDQKYGNTKYNVGGQGRGQVGLPNWFVGREISDIATFK